MRRSVVFGALVCLLSFVFLGVRFHNVSAANDEDDNGYSQISIFAKALQLIRQDYVDGSKTSYHDLITAAMKGMLFSLDPHSQFMDPNDFRDMQDDTRSRFNGLGVEVSIKNGLPTVVSAMEDTPAAKAGLHGATGSRMVDGQPYSTGGDVITAVDGKKVTSAADLQRMIDARSPDDTVSVTYSRDGKTQTVQVKLAGVESVLPAASVALTVKV